MNISLDRLQVRTAGIGQFIEITELVDEAVVRSGIGEGIALVRSRHTTAAVTCSEPDLRLHRDMMDAVNETFPATRDYRHIEAGPENAVAHIATSLLFGESTWVPVRGGRVDLGAWQHLYLVELNEPRTREVDVAVLGE